MNFDIDSNAFDANLLKLKLKLHRLNSKKAQRDVAKHTKTCERPCVKYTMIYVIK